MGVRGDKARGIGRRQPIGIDPAPFAFDREVAGSKGTENWPLNRVRFASHCPSVCCVRTHARWMVENHRLERLIVDARTVRDMNAVQLVFAVAHDQSTLG